MPLLRVAPGLLCKLLILERKSRLCQSSNILALVNKRNSIHFEPVMPKMGILVETACTWIRSDNNNTAVKVNDHVKGEEVPNQKEVMIDSGAVPSQAVDDVTVEARIPNVQGDTDRLIHCQ